MSSAVVHVMKQYNRLTWEGSLDLNYKYPELNNTFRFRYFNPMTLQREILMGTWTSDEIMTQLTNTAF